MKKIRTLIADDEPLARERIVNLLCDEQDIDIIAECKNGNEVVKAISQHDVDLMFLDVQMPKSGGFAAIKEIPPERLPVIIFTTAYEDYAIQAFEVGAADYLLKPFDRKRFHNALDRAREKLDSKDFYSMQLLKYLRSVPEKKEFPEKITVKTGSKILFLPTIDVEWIESEANYIRLHTKDASYLLRETINTFHSKLDPKVFIRIHRSTIVNFNFVKELQPWFNDNYIVILKDGTKLSIGRTYRKNIDTLFIQQ